MARRHDRQARDFGPGPSPESTGTLREARARAANDNRKSGQSYTSALPCDALAFIEPVPMAVNQAGRARRDMWTSEEHTYELQSLKRNSSSVFCFKKLKMKILISFKPVTMHLASK